MNHGTSQIQGISGAVDRLCNELGVGNGGGSSVIKDLRDLVQSNDAGNIAGLIERQKKEQEELLRAVAAELSNEIRGERLRFVEAMKEATAINVQGKALTVRVRLVLTLCSPHRGVQERAEA